MKRLFTLAVLILAAFTFSLASCKSDDDDDPTYYTVTFNTDGGSTVSSQTVESGKTATKPADPTKEGYTFAGWYNGDTEFDFATQITANITLTAHWTAQSTDPATTTYTVTLTGGANATASGGETTQSGLSGAMTTVTYTANSGYHFAEFTAITDNGITATRTNDTTVTVSGTPTGNASITIPDAVAAAPAALAKLSDAFVYTYTPDGMPCDDGYVSDLMDLTAHDEWQKYYNGDGTLKYPLAEDEAKTCADYLGDKTVVVYATYYNNGGCYYKYAMNTNGTISTGESMFVFMDSNAGNWSDFDGYSFYVPKSAE